MSIENLAFSGGGGFLFGAVAGYVIKKVMKIAAIIIGLFVAALAYLSKGLLDVKWVAMGNVTRHTLKNFTATKPVEVGISYRLPIDNSTFSHIDTKKFGNLYVGIHHDKGEAGTQGILSAASVT